MKSLFSIFKKRGSIKLESKASDIEQAIENGLLTFFQQQHQKVPAFVDQYFRYPGCWHTNRVAFGLDLIKAPINLLWAPIYVLLVLILMALSVLGYRKSLTWARSLPSGMTTKVQTRVNEKIQKELLDTDIMKKAILSELKRLPEVQQIAQHEQAQTDLNFRLDNIIEESLKQLMLTRTASADIANTLFSAVVGAIAFNKFTPGGFGIGILLAAYWVTENAKQNFFLGPIVGGWYYSVFPPEVNWLERGAGVLIVMLALAVIASFSGLITDPVQSRLRLHHRRLHRMLNQLEKDLINRSSSRFKPLDPYVARILEIFDTLKTQFSF